MINTKQQIKHSFIYLLPIGVGTLIPILTLPIFTRALTKEDFGIFALAQVYATFVTGLANFGLTVGYERNFFQYKDSAKSSGLLYSVIFFITACLLIIGIFTYLFKSQLSKLVTGSPGYGWILFWSFCLSGIINIKNFYLIYFRNTENAKAFTRYTIDETVIGTILSLFMVVYLKTGVIGLVWGQMFASLVILIVLGFNFWKVYPFTFSREALNDSLKISYPLTFKVLWGTVGSQFDKYLVGMLASIGGAGIYSIGQRLSYTVFTFMTAIQNVFAPQVYKQMFGLGEKGNESVGRYLTPFIYISIAYALIVSLFSEEIIKILTPESYHGTVDIIIILSMLYASMFFGKQPQLVFAKKTHISSFLSIINSVLTVALNIPFIMRWGVIGAAWATFLAGLISGLVHFVVSQRYYEIKWEYKKIGLIFMVFFTSSIAIILLRNINVDYYIRVMTKLISLFFYIYIGIKIDVITMNNFLMVKDIIMTRKSKEVAT